MMPLDVPTRCYVLAPDRDAADLAEALSEHLPRAVVGRARLRTLTLLDTADRRLRAEGLDLTVEATSSGGARLTVQKRGGARSAEVASGRMLRRYRAADLPAGRLRDRLAPLMDVRALVPIVELRRREVPVTVCNRDAKTVVRLVCADLWALPRTADPPSRLSGRVDVTGILGYPRPFARVDAVLAQRFEMSAASEESSDEAVLSLGGDPEGLASRLEVALTPDEPARHAAARILGRLADVVEANVPGTLADLDPEFLHDLRVAVRRSRSVLRELKGVFDREARRENADALRWIQTVTGSTRDLDVQLLEWEELVAQFPDDRRGELAPVRALLVEKRAAAFRTMKTALRSPQYRQRWAAWRDFLTRSSGPEQPTAQEVAGRRLRSVYRRMVRDGRAIDDTSPPQALHDLRKRGKELRYLLELFGGLWPAKTVKPMVTSLKNLQQVLGRHQDREVQAATLRSLAPELAASAGGAEALLALGSLVDRLIVEQRQARGQFAPRFAEFASLKVPGERAR